MSLRRPVAAFLLFSAFALTSFSDVPSAHAKPVATISSRLEASSVLGPDAPVIAGWNEIVVNIDNSGQPAFRGEVAIEPFFEVRTVDRPSLRVPVSIAANESTRLMLPYYINPGSYPAVVMRSGVDGDIANVKLGITRSIEDTAIVVEIQGDKARGAKLLELTTGDLARPADTSKEGEEPARKRIKMRGDPEVFTAQVAKETRDPILADVAVGWSGALLVVMPTDILARLTEAQRDSLVHWVRSGGSLALWVSREEDLKGESLVNMAGGEVRLTSGASAPTRSFRGGALSRIDLTTDDGEGATFGLGDVTLLRRDPWQKGGDDTSAKSLFALFQRAQMRRLNLLSAPAGRSLAFVDDPRVRLVLDPNRSFRPSLGIAAGLVVFYAVLVGPIAFAIARRRKRPLSVLKVVPLSAAGMFALLVGLGMLSKGLNGHVRRIEFVDAGGGAKKAASTSMASFYLSDPSGVEFVSKSATDAFRLLEPARDVMPLDLDRTGMALRGLRVSPWSTFVVAQESVADLGDGIVLEGTGARLSLTNNTKYTLEHVILHPENSSGLVARSRWFDKVAPGDTIVARDGAPVARSFRPASAEGDLADDKIAKDEIARTTLDAIDTLVGASGPIALPTELPAATAIVRRSGQKLANVSLERDVMVLRVLGLGGGKGKGELPSKDPTGKEKDL